MAPWLPLWIRLLALVGLMASLAASTMLSYELDIPMVAGGLLVLHAMCNQVSQTTSLLRHVFFTLLESLWYKQLHIVSLLWRFPFTLLERNDMPPWLFFISIAICTLPYPSRVFVEVTKIIAKAADDLSQAYAIKQLREQFADHVSPDVVEALKRAHDSRIDELKKELKNSEDKKKSLKTELDIAKSAVSLANRKHEKLELQLQELRNSPELDALRRQEEKDRGALMKAKNACSTLQHEKGELEIQFSQAQDRHKRERESLIKQNRSEVEDLKGDQEATLRDKDRQIDQQAAQIDQQAAKIRALEMESESTAQCKQEVIDQQRQTISQMEGQVAELDAEIQKLAQQTNFLDAFRNLVNAMINSGNETAVVTAIQFLFALKTYGIDLAQLGVDSHVFENLLKAVLDKREGDLQIQANCLALLQGSQEGSFPAFDPPTGLEMPGLEMPGLEIEGSSFPNHFSGNTGFGGGQPIADQTMVPPQPDHDIGMFRAPQLTSISFQGPSTPVVPPVNKSGGFLRGLLNPIPPPANSSGVIGSSTSPARANPPRASNAVPPPANSSGVQGFTMNPIGSSLGGNLQRAANAVPPPAKSTGVQGFTMNPIGSSLGGNLQRAANAVPPPAKSTGVQGFTMNPAPTLPGISKVPWYMSSSSGGDGASSSKSARSSRYSHGERRGAPY